MINAEQIASNGEGFQWTAPEVLRSSLRLQPGSFKRKMVNRLSEWASLIRIKCNNNLIIDFKVMYTGNVNTVEYLDLFQFKPRHVQVKNVWWGKQKVFGKGVTVKSPLVGQIKELGQAFWQTKEGSSSLYEFFNRRKPEAPSSVFLLNKVTNGVFESNWDRYGKTIIRYDQPPLVFLSKKERISTFNRKRSDHMSTMTVYDSFCGSQVFIRTDTVDVEGGTVQLNSGGVG